MTQMKLSRPVKHGDPLNIRLKVPSISFFLYCILFVSIFLFFRYTVDPCLIYQFQEPPFLVDSEFFSNFSEYPGGLLWYCSAFFTQLYVNQWIGALVITAFLFLNFLQSVTAMKSIGLGRNPEIFAYMPLSLMLCAYGSYKMPLSYAIGLFAALSFFNLYKRLSPENSIFRVMLFTCSLLALYYFASLAALLYAILCAIDELLHRRKYITCTVMLAVAALIPYAAAKYFFVISMPGAYHDYIGLKTNFFETATFPSTPLIVYAMYGYFPLVLLIRNLILVHICTSSAATQKVETCNRFLRTYGIQVVVYTALTAGIAYQCFDEKAKMNERVSLCASRGKWNEIIRLIRPDHLKDFTVTSQVQLFRALYFSNRLLSNLFSYPLGMQCAALLHCMDDSKHFPQKSDIYFDIGQLNFSELFAQEALATAGKKPSILQRLALIHLLEGRKESARTYLNVLDKTMCQKAWAEKYLRLIDSDLLIDNDEYLRIVRSYMPRKDHISAGFCRALENTFEGDHSNRAAFEFLMAISLLKGDMRMIVKYVDYFKTLGYATLPRPIQEALICQGAIVSPSAGGYQFDEALLRQYDSFTRIMEQYGRTDEAMSRLSRQFGDSYWLYLLSAQAPVR
jgi:hypothetical protein